ncbi:hypothetical protein WLF18_12215 [Pseudomonas shirazensis]|uniref:Apea-like HEPN domain-containing protein n=1 Tax=Pseudomonas shirazensis TaxID=2745494 RepID=A0ABU8ZZT9_9PSED
MTPKQLRSAQADLQVLLKPANLLSEVTSFKKFGFIESLRREVRTPNGSKVCFGDRAVESYNRLSRVLAAELPSREFVERGDINSACKSVLGRWYEDDVSGDLAHYIRDVESLVSQSVRVHEYYSPLSGLELLELEKFEFGNVAIHKPRLEVLKSSVGLDAVISSAWQQTNHGLWLTAKIKGSADYAERRFFDLVKVTCGMLALSFTTCLERGGAAVRLIPAHEGSYKPGAVTWFSLDADSRTLNLKTSFDGLQRLDFTPEHATSLLECEWFQELVRVSQSGSGNDAECSLRRALHWFFDAQADTSLDMKFVKYWSCIECMFSKSKIKVVDQIRRGLTSLLCYGRYGYSSPEGWKSIDRRVVELYDLRSIAVHDAQHGHVEFSDVVDVSKWAAFILMEVAMMVARGMQNRTQLKEEVECIQEYHCSPKFKTNYSHFYARFSEARI